MIESIIRELVRFQDTLSDLIPLKLWSPWAEANEEVIDFLNEYYLEKEGDTEDEN